jgi:flagellar basal-body rod protein FlgB
MNEITDTAILSALGQQLNRAVAKQVTAASNLANIDTPGYRAREVSFDDVLGNELHKQGLASTNAAHLAGSVGTTGVSTTEADGLAARRDGNNVQIDRELLNMSSAAPDFSAAQTALAAKFRLIRYAITEGR